MMKNIKMKMGTISLVITAIVIACVIVLNIIVGMVTEKTPIKIDLTQDNVYEFSKQTKDVMKNLDAEVTAYAIIPEGLNYEYTDYIKPYLEKYRAINDKFVIKYIDPYEDTAFLNKYTETGQQIGIGSVIIECGDQYKVVTLDQLYTQSYFEDVEYIDMEKQITNAVMVVTGQLSAAKVYFNTGHGNETAESYGLEPLLTQEGYVCGTFSSVTEDIPEDADIVVSILPMYDYATEEIVKLDAFLDRGGRFIVIGSEGMPEAVNLNTYLGEWGLKMNGGYVIEKDSASSMSDVYGFPVPIVKINEHTITSKLTGTKSPLIMPNSMSISTMKSSNGAMATQLLTTSEKAYAKQSVAETMEKETDDVQGPLCLAAISERIGDESSAIMVIGSFYAVSDPGTVNSGTYLNSDFILNSLSYMSGVKVSSDIRAKQITPEAMAVTIEQANVMSIVLIWILPIGIILIGFFIWIKRRFK